MTRRALITGITGQDGSYLSELLLAKGYQVHGIVRRVSTIQRPRIDHLPRAKDNDSPGLVLHYGDLADANSINAAIMAARPHEVYNLAAQSHVSVSFEIPLYSADVVGMGTIRLLEAVRQLSNEQPVRFYQASSSEMYGKVAETPQRETTPFHPRSPYACAKVFSYYQTQNYREAYGLFACNGILFNHESPRRGETFVTRKITLAVARIHEGLQKKLRLGNIDSRRDWGHARDYIEAMWLMLQQEEPDDYVVATGETHSVREFLELAFGSLEMDWQDHVEIDPKYFRPAEVDLLLGDPAKATEKLGWKSKTSFKGLVHEMVQSDLALVRTEKSVAQSMHRLAS